MRGKFADLGDQKFGKWTVLRRTGNDKKGNARWMCRCACGHYVVCRADHLLSGETTQCRWCKNEAQTGKKRPELAKKFTGKGNPNYKGGYINRDGYKIISVNGKPMLEHRHVMEIHLKRKLKSWEVPHHKDLDKTNNNLDNLQLITLAQNTSLHQKIRYAERQQQRKFLYERERKATLDIETTNLTATYGIVICWVMQDVDTGKMYSGRINKKDLVKGLDKRILRKFLETISKFDRIITFYGKRFDVPYLRSRCLSLGLPFPEAGSLAHEDLYFIARYRLKQHNNKLATTLRAIFGESQKTVITPEYWLAALRGKESALRYIHHHCVMDVKETTRLWKVLRYQKIISRKGI